MEGYESTWSQPGTINSVRYNNIPAGTYIFRVKAKTGKKEWIKNELTVEVKIKEAYYKSWWFWALCATTFIAAIWGFLRYRIYRSKKREKELEEQVKIRTLELEKEKHKSEELLLNILPAEIADELKKNGAAKAKRHELVTVMFSDFKGFTKISEQLEPEQLVAEIDLCFRGFDEIIEKHGLEKIKTVGDAYLCVGGISKGDKNEALRVVKAGLEIQEFMNGIAVGKKI